MLTRRWFHILSLFVAANYFAFRVELFDEERETNSPKFHSGWSIVPPSLNWETFDKDNAPQAIVVDAGIRFELLLVVPPAEAVNVTGYEPFRMIQDKSPPL